MKVTYKGHYGSDLEVVNCARVSFSSESTEFTKRDKHLIKFLARGCTTKDWEELFNEITLVGMNLEDEKLLELLNHVKRMPSHWVPFANGGHIKLHFKVPLFVARQLQKHTAGFNPWSEVSRRYVDSDPEFYVPNVWRGRSEDKKQGSTGVVVLSEDIVDRTYEGDFGGIEGEIYDVERFNGLAFEMYMNLIDQGVAPEQARMVLPQSMYTEFVWSGNLYAWASLYNTRSWGDSQAETANVAQQIKEIVEPLFPISWRELTQ